MMKRWFPIAGCAAAALVLFSASTSTAQLFFLPNIGTLGRYYYPGMYQPGAVGYNYLYPAGAGFNSTTMINTPLYYGAPYGAGAAMPRPGIYPSVAPAMAGFAGYGSVPGYGGYPGYGGISTVNYAPPSPMVYTPSTMPRIAPIKAASFTTPPDNSAVIDVKLPAGAQLWFDGKRMKQTGRERTFTTPSLDKGKSFHYTLEATWMKDGKPVTEKRTVPVRAGARISVAFPKPSLEP